MNQGVTSTPSQCGPQGAKAHGLHAQGVVEHGHVMHGARQDFAESALQRGGG
jgi:hypothetical protein